jgi:putative serine protease PepD
VTPAMAPVETPVRSFLWLLLGSAPGSALILLKKTVLSVEQMDRELAGVTEAEPRPAQTRGLRRRRAAGLAVVVVLVAVIAVLAVLATRRETTGVASPAATPRPSAAASPSVSAIYQRVRPSVVVVRTNDELGSGVVVADDGTILTANHVIAGATKITVLFFDGTTTSATVVSKDPRLDVAVLRPASLPEVVVPAALGGDTGVGAPVVAVGNPLGLADSVSAGVVSGLDRTARTAEGTFSGLIQFDASVNPGSSGGPLLDARGLVIGIVVSIANPAHEDAFAGIGFARPIGSALGAGRGAGPGRGPEI